MWWQYVLVFIGAFLVDVSPFPLPPAFTVMIFLQITFGIPIWPTIIIGVIGSVVGRYVLTLYISKISHRIFKPAKNEDVQFLGAKLKERGWQSQLFVVSYSLLPLPTTPLFLAAGMAKIKPPYIIPAFFIGKFTSDALAVFTGEYAAKNTVSLINGIISWQSILGLAIGIGLIFALLFIDWRTLIIQGKLKLKFDIWN